MLRFRRPARPILFAVLAAAFVWACDDSPTDTGSTSTEYTLEAVRSEASPFGVLRFELPAGAPAPTTEALQAVELDGQRLGASMSENGTIMMIVPEVAPGAYRLSLPLGAMDRGVMNVTVLPAIEVADPDATVDTLTDAMSVLFDEVELLSTDASVEANIALARASLAHFRANWDAAPASEQLAIATFIEANPELLEAFRTTEAAMAASRLQGGSEESSLGLMRKAVALAGATVLLQDMVAGTVGVCQGALGTGPIGVAVGCAPVTVSFGAAVGAAAGSMYYTLEVTNRAVIGGKRLIARVGEWLSDDGEMIAAQSAGGGSSAQTFYNGVSVPLTVSQSYRSPRRSDAGTVEGVLGEFLAMASRLETFLEQLRSWYDSLASLISFGDAEPSSNTALFPEQEVVDTVGLSASDVSITALSNPNVSCTIAGQGSELELTCITDTEEEQEFTLNFVRESELGSAEGEISGVLQVPQIVLEIVSGDMQTALPGDTLPDSLVVRVSGLNDSTSTDTIPGDSSGVDAQVLWEITSGAGQLKDTTAINSDGLASVSWVLGPEEGEQSVSARALVNGEEVAGSPVSFLANADRGTVLQEMSGNSQSGDVGFALGEPLVVRTVDSQAQIVEEAEVVWNVVSGNGSLSAASTTTDASGEGSVQWTMGSMEDQIVEAAVYDWRGEHVAGSPVQFVASPSDGMFKAQWSLGSLNGIQLPITEAWSDVCTETLDWWGMDLQEGGVAQLHEQYTYSCAGEDDQVYYFTAEGEWGINSSGNFTIVSAGTDGDDGITLNENTPFEFNGTNELVLLETAKGTAVFDRQ